MKHQAMHDQTAEVTQDHKDDKDQTAKGQADGALAAKDQLMQAPKDQLIKDQGKPETGSAGNRRSGARERVWLAPALTPSMAPLLAGLGIDLVGPDDRGRATILVEAPGIDARTGTVTGRIRVERVGGASLDSHQSRDFHDGDDSYRTRHEHATSGGNDPIETVELDGSSLWAAASWVVSQAFGLPRPLLTTDATMFAVIRAAVRAGRIDSPILVSGETGTGKELLVRLIHAASGRAGEMFTINCAALNEAVVPRAPGDGPHGAMSDENRLDELFAALGTTLFLDQVSELSRTAQTRLLRAILQADEGEPGDPVIGKVRSGARLIAATNRPLASMVQSGEFKRELYDRLAVLTLSLPPLRVRRSDIPLLARGYLRLAAPHLRFTPGALKTLGKYSFPGNVRELRNLVTRFAVLQRDATSQLIQTADVRPELTGPAVGASIWKSSPFRARREMALQALMVCGGDRAAAASKLGISVRALQRHVISTSYPTATRGH